MAIRKRDTSKKRNIILDAAIQAFEEKGFENASMDYVAEVSNSSKRTVYNHFSSKDELFNAMNERFIDEIIDIKEIAYQANEPIGSQLEKFIDAKIAICRNEKWLAIMKISIGVFIANPKAAEQTMEKVMALEAPLINWLKAASEDSKLNVESVELAASVFSSMMSGAIFWPTLLHGAIPNEQIQIIKQEIVSVFLAKYQAI